MERWFHVDTVLEKISGDGASPHQIEGWFHAGAVLQKIFGEGRALTKWRGDFMQAPF